MNASDSTQSNLRSAGGSGPAKPVRVMVVDDQAVFRRVARAVIAATPGFMPVGGATSGPEAIEGVHDLRPDLVLMDVNMPGMDGFEAARQLTAAHPSSVVVLVSVEHSDALSRPVGSCGAVAFLPKQELRPATLRALWTLYGPSG